jgi:hypothetical protein
MRARIRVDFHLSPHGHHILASMAEVEPWMTLAAGDVVEAYDGDLLSLLMLCDAPR